MQFKQQIRYFGYLPGRITVAFRTEIGSTDDVIVRCNGRVIRNDSPNEMQDKNGVACVIDSYEFIRAALQKSGT